MRILQTSKITGLGRIYLGREVMDALGVDDGDHIMIYRDRNGKLYIDRPVPASRHEEASA